MKKEFDNATRNHEGTGVHTSQAPCEDEDEPLLYLTLHLASSPIRLHSFKYH